MENNVFFSTLIRNKRKIMFFFSVHLWSEIKRKCFFFCSPFIRNIKKIMLLFSVHLLSEIKRNSRFFFSPPSRNALTEMCVLHDLLSVAREKRHLVLDPVSVPQPPSKLYVQFLGLKKVRLYFYFCVIFDDAKIKIM